MAEAAQAKADRLKAAAANSAALYDALHVLARLEKSYAEMEQAALEMCTKLNGFGPAEAIRGRDAADIEKMAKLAEELSH